MYESLHTESRRSFTFALSLFPRLSARCKDVALRLGTLDAGKALSLLRLLRSAVLGVEDEPFLVLFSTLIVGTCKVSLDVDGFWGRAMGTSEWAAGVCDGVRLKRWQGSHYVCKLRGDKHASRQQRSCYLYETRSGVDSLACSPRK